MWFLKTVQRFNLEVITALNMSFPLEIHTVCESPFHWSPIKNQQPNPYLLMTTPNADIHSSMNLSMSGWVNQNSAEESVLG